MAPVARMKERDQRFLLIGITPSFKEKPARAAAANPRMKDHTIHLKRGVVSFPYDFRPDLMTLAFHSWCMISIRPAAVPSQTKAMLRQGCHHTVVIQRN